jgi:hypothetical protein
MRVSYEKDHWLLNVLMRVSLVLVSQSTVNMPDSTAFSFGCGMEDWIAKDGR